MGCGPSSNAGGVAREEGGGARSHTRLRPPPPWSQDPPKTKAELAHMRQQFWESQTAGRPQVWDALRVASEALLSHNTELANTVMVAAEIRAPSGDLSLCYDMLGASYKVPRFCYSDPSNVLSEAAAASMAASKRKPHAGPVTSLGAVTIRISPSAANSEQDVKLPSLRSDTTVAEAKYALHELLASGVTDQKGGDGVKRPNQWIGTGLPVHRQRLFLRGRELRDDLHMQEAGADAASVLQVFIRPE